MAEVAEVTTKPFEFMNRVRTDAPTNPELKAFNLPKISELVRKGDMSPLKLRELADQYNQAGVEIVQTEGLSVASVKIFSDGHLSAEIPTIEPFGNDMVAVHTFTHLEQLLNGQKNSATPGDILATSWQKRAIAEIGALEISLVYADSLRNSEKNKSLVERIKARLKVRREDLSQQGIKVNEVDKLNPYKKL